MTNPIVTWYKRVDGNVVHIEPVNRLGDFVGDSDVETYKKMPKRAKQHLSNELNKAFVDFMNGKKFPWD